MAIWLASGAVVGQPSVIVLASSATGLASGFYPDVIIIDDTHDGDKGKKRFEKEVRDKKRRRQQILDAYENLLEFKPSVAKAIAAPYIEESAERPALDVDAMLADLQRIEMLIREHQELDDEQGLLLLS